MSKTTSKPKNILWGIEEIAEEISRDPRAAYRMLASGQLPAKKIGKQWCSTREALAEFFASGMTPRT